MRKQSWKGEHTLAGLQVAVNMVPGPVVALAARGDLMAVVWHGPPSPLSGSQSLAFAVYDANQRTLHQEGALVISSRSTLTWLAFTEEDLLATFDSQVGKRRSGEGLGASDPTNGSMEFKISRGGGATSDKKSMPLDWWWLQRVRWDAVSLRPW